MNPSDSKGNKSPFSLLKALWPVESFENKKVLPMCGMMFFVLMNYSMLRSIKDGLIVTNVGAEAIGFIKLYMVLPSAILAMLAYTKLYNILTQDGVFYTITGVFVSYFMIFGLFIFPNAEALHPSSELVESLALDYPRFKWFIKLWGKWSFAIFYIMAELWGSLMLSLLFWQFANRITKIKEAKRFYPLFPLVGNFGLIFTKYFISTVLGNDKANFFPLFVALSAGGISIIFLYRWITSNVLTDPRLYSKDQIVKKKNKVKLSVFESLKMILSSKYLGLIALLVLSYGISIILVEGIWKSKVRALYPDEGDYIMFMGNFQGWQGWFSIIFTLIGGAILRNVSWGFAAMFTPLMVLVTGLLFFGFIFFDNDIAMYLSGITAASTLSLAVTFGMAQNILAKSTKYSLFDGTKEIAYIPLEDEMKSKGKAAVDVIGGRFGKSGGGFISSSFFILFPAFDFVTASPYFALIFIGIVVIWIAAVRMLHKEYNLIKDRG